jgi:hypothetical protein
MMECLQAISLVSEAMDHEPVSVAALAEAKEHCRTCPECTAFVRAQLTVKSAPLPSPPTDLVDRAMQRVQAEVAATLPPTEADGATESVAKAEDSEAPSIPAVSLVRRPRQQMRLPRPWAVGILVLAVIAALLVTGAIIVFGLRQMSASSENDNGVKSYTYTPGQGGSSASSGGGQTSTVGGPHFIVVSGLVYQEGEVAKPSDAHNQMGTTTSALGTDSKPVQRAVLAGASRETVYVADDDKTLRSFNLVTRSYLGKTYALAGGDITDYGQWPTLPAQFSEPTSDDGSPTFRRIGVDSSGVDVYAPPAESGANGIAVAPGSDTGPTANEPNWTWWQPLK